MLTVGSAGGRVDATQVRCVDLGQAGGDELISQVRRKLRREYGWPKGEGHFYDVPTIVNNRAAALPVERWQLCAEPESGSNLRMTARPASARRASSPERLDSWPPAKS